MTRRRKVTPPGWEEQEELTCPLCGRVMPDGSWNEHHLVPATFKGTEKVALHKICHNAIHMNITNRELKNNFNSIPQLLTHPGIQKFIKWVSSKSPDFYKGFKGQKVTY